MTSYAHKKIKEIISCHISDRTENQGVRHMRWHSDFLEGLLILERIIILFVCLTHLVTTLFFPTIQIIFNEILK